MKKIYLSKAAIAAAVLAMAGSGVQAEETWKDVTGRYLKNVAHVPGWRGGMAASDFGVGETWSGAFELYQVLYDMPAGEYTLTANAFYRCASNDKAQAAMADGSNHNAKIFINTAEGTVKGIWDENLTEYPNNLEAANARFSEGLYLNSVKFNHEGGDLRIGIRNYGGSYDEWTAFDNFKLTMGGTDYTDRIVNADFAQGMEGGTGNAAKSDEVWDNANIDGGYKYPDKNRKGGIWRKMGGSAYNTGQKISLPKGTFRFGVQSFMRYGNGNMENTYITHKGSWTMCENGQDGKYSPLYYHNNGLEDENWNAYVYITNGWDTDEEGKRIKPASAEYALDPDFGNPNGVYNQTAIKCIYDEKWDVYPDNNPSVEAHADWAVGNEDSYGWDDSGWEYQAARFFVAHPEAYRNYVTITLSEPSEVWVGIKKDVNAPYGYWNPWVDYTLDQLSDEGGVEGVAADLEEDAPVEYYNLQGMRVANPSNGLFIVKQGKKATKQVF